jgi:hypothetical protein
VQNASYANYPDESYIYLLRLNSVKVTVDYVNENAIAGQIYVIAETYLNAKQNYDMEADKTLIVDITVTQRAFMYNIDIYNTIYVTADAHDESGATFSRESVYISGKKTIVSVTEQNGILRKLLNRMIKNQEKHNRKTMKVRK